MRIEEHNLKRLFTAKFALFKYSSKLKSMLYGFERPTVLMTIESLGSDWDGWWVYMHNYSSTLGLASRVMEVISLKSALVERFYNI